MMKRNVRIGIPLILALGAVVIANNAKSQVQPNEASPRPVEEKQATVPFQVRFDTPDPPRLNKPVTVTLVVENGPKAWPPSAQEGESRTSMGNRLEVLLRLPVGVKLASEGWRSVESPPEEKDDPSGPWSLFESVQPVSVPLESSLVLARVPISLTVVEEGINWVITTRVRLIRGKEAWQTFGVVFATLQPGVAEFHSAPRATGPPQNGGDDSLQEQSPSEKDAEANRS